MGNAFNAPKKQSSNEVHFPLKKKFDPLSTKYKKPITHVERRRRPIAFDDENLDPPHYAGNKDWTEAALVALMIVL
ncbi:hypothetical protein A2U01_0033740, partial [Trifolium medium]|nr:hypothetical protein [Trifolium medium]